MNWLQLNGKKYSFEDLRQGKFQNVRTEFENATLSFCNDWLTNKQEFKFQSSGSTGPSQKISFSRNQIQSSIDRSQRALGFKKNETALVCLDTKYVAGQVMLARCMHSSMNCIALEPSANPLKGLIKDYIHFAAFVPYQVQTILSSTEVDIFNRIKTKIIGGAALDAKTAAKLEHLPNSIFATYGMTETLTHIALQKLNHPDKSEVFTALDGINIAVDNRNCLTLEIPAISKEKIITNDIVELTGSNQFCWKGRFDNVINSGGVKINPENIERAVEKVAHDLLIKAQFIIAGVDDAKLGQKIILICDSDLDASQQENILSGLSKKLSAFEIPRTIYFVVPFIYTNTGKIDRIKTIKQITSAPTSN